MALDNPEIFPLAKIDTRPILIKFYLVKNFRHTYTHTYTHTYIYMYVHMYVCPYIRTYILTSTHTYIAMLMFTRNGTQVQVKDDIAFKKVAFLKMVSSF